MGDSSDTTTSKGSKGPTLEWMYKPAALVDREEYLTGRSVDKSLKLLDAIEKGNNPTATEFNYLQEAEKDLTPISIFAPNQGAVGPVDIIKKIKDDPLYQIQKKEQESLKKLLQNPVKMKQLNQLVEARSSTSSSSKKHKKKHHHKKHKKKEADDKDHHRRQDRHRSSSSSKHKRRRSRSSSSSSSSSDDNDRRKDRCHASISTSSRGDPTPHSSRSRRKRSRSRSSGSDSDDSDRERQRQEIIERFKRRVQERKGSTSRDRDRNRPSVPAVGPPSRPAARPKLDEEEIERRRREMMENAKWREQQRTKCVNKYREEEKKEEENLKGRDRDPDFIRKQLLEAAATGSVEKRVKSNSYNIQRSKGAMDQNFAKR